MKNKNNMDEKAIIKLIQEEVQKEVKKGLSFTAHKTTDTPTDALNPVNRKYVTRNGATASRPTSSILGEFYFDTTTGFPVWWNGAGWVKADGTAG